MTKAVPIDRLELTRRKMQAREELKRQRREALRRNIENWDNVPAAPGAEEHQEPAFDEHHCPLCGGELTRWEGCWRCKQCGWSKC